MAASRVTEIARRLGPGNEERNADIFRELLSRGGEPRWTLNLLYLCATKDRCKGRRFLDQPKEEGRGDRENKEGGHEIIDIRFSCRIHMGKKARSGGRRVKNVHKWWAKKGGRRWKDAWTRHFKEKKRSTRHTI